MTMGIAFFQRIAAPAAIGFTFGAILFGAGAILGIAGASAALAGVASSSPWVTSTSSKARLVSGTVDLDGTPTLLAGVQLRMDPGWKTYWKNPGDSGVPPSFDWAGSKNLKHAEMLYPAPHRFADANGTAIGYDDEVTFPVKLTPEREGEPIELKLAFAYGLCKDLCVPNDVSLGLALPPDMGKGDAPLIASFLVRVPKPAKDGALPLVSGVEAKLDGKSPELLVDAVFPPNAAGTDLFIEAGDVFIPASKALGPLDGGKQRFAITFGTPAEASAIKGKTLALTLVSDQGSTETMWTAE
jgi:DsbC/DsbD-like thiol-disulfide interchange protein